MNTPFASFAPNTLIVCTGIQIGAPKGIIGKAFLLGADADGAPVLPVLDDIVPYEGDCAKWRAATISDVGRQVAHLITNGDDLQAQALGTVGDWLRANPERSLPSPYADVGLEASDAA